MASTTAMFTGLSGLNANARNLDVIGNNIANVNTTAYKSNRMMFASMFSRTFSLGTAPSAETGGANPGQVGLGVAIAGTQRDFRGGSLSTTGDQRDLAIEGDGFFIVNRSGSQFYTRAGSFRQNSVNELTTISGERVMGFGVDDQFNIVNGALVPLTIPVGSLTLAEATRNVRFTGNLNADGNLPTQGSEIALNAMGLLSGPIGGAGGPLLDPTSLLTGIENFASPGNPLFTAGQSFQLSGATKGSKRLPEADLAINSATTVQNLLDFISDALGIDTTVGANPDGSLPGARLDPVTGIISVVGNTGSVSDLDLEPSDLRVLDAAGAIAAEPFTPTKSQTADGEAVRTTFVVFDSLGSPLNVDLTMVLEGRSDAGTSWRYFVESADDTDLNLQVGSGTITFDTFGQFSGTPNTSVTINRDNTGAVDPLSIDLSFISDSDRVTALADTGSTIAATYQDGSPLGTLSSYSVGIDGVITGAFTNGLTRTVAQVALATFSNPEGLVDIGANLFGTGPNSGSAQVTTPTVLGAGRVLGGALELSNVDLSQEFINMILASTGYSASSRVITTCDQLMQQLLVLGR